MRERYSRKTQESDVLIYLSCSIGLLLDGADVDTSLLTKVMGSVVFRSREPLLTEELCEIVSTTNSYRSTRIYQQASSLSQLLHADLAYVLAFSQIFFWQKRVEQSINGSLDESLRLITSMFNAQTSEHAIDRFKIFIYELDLDAEFTDIYESLDEVLDSSLFPNNNDKSELLASLTAELRGIQHNKTLAEHRSATIIIYRWFVEFCKQHDFRFFIIGGNVLGAVRNGKMIPWDDDVDVVMRYPDYERFHSCIAEALPEPYYWSHPYNNPTHPRFFGKIVHNGKCCIDIFPVVKTPDQQTISKLHFLANKVLYRSYIQKIGFLDEINPKRFHAPLFKAFIPLIPKRYILKIAYWNMARYEKRNKRYKYTSICGRYGFYKELFERSWIEEGPEYLIFEEIQSPVFSAYTRFLVLQYGDYMLLPSLYKRIEQHNLVFLKDY
jgi:lipopolysaccharide cholinephosphotransferase